MSTYVVVLPRPKTRHKPDFVKVAARENPIVGIIAVLRTPQGIDERA
jgi:hypothetical protein